MTNGNGDYTLFGEADSRTVFHQPPGTEIVTVAASRVYRSLEEIVQWLTQSGGDYYHEDFFSLLFTIDQDMSFFFSDPIIAVEFKLRFG